MAIRRPRGWRLRGIVLGIAAGAAAASTLAGCSSTGTDTGGDVTGTVTVLVSSAPGSDKAFDALNTAFEAKYPGVKVDFSSVPNETFASSRSTRLTAGNLDVTLAAPKEAPSYAGDASQSDDNLAADAGLFLDLSNEDFVKNFTPSVIDALKYKDKTYTLPAGLSYYTGVYYNKALFEKNGLSVPTTWSEWENVVSTLKAAGVTPLGIGGKDSWPAGLDMIAAVQGLYPTTDDKEKLAEDLWEKKAKLTDPTEVEVLDRVKALYDAADPNFPGVGYDAIPGDFASGKVAMTIDGTWNQTTIDSAVAGAFDYGYFPLPASDNAADNATLGGKVEFRLAAASNAPNKTAALAYLKFFSQPENYKKFVEICGFAPSQPDVATSDFLKGLEQYTTTFTPAWDTLWTQNVNAGQGATFPFNYTAVAPMGTSTPQEAAKTAQSDWAAAG
ncbi:extracellular solute-binding protein [Galbitalea sp. SE-J8]|uniref:ABC transporter substrate-binding protein n=1 Tax=Galbitalea sp. SE-J8 TaxID=3054952 RepID=UPI00259CB913|nr:extracellular solute-binding protein [Galbitalea sp. SE-J8]MDM4763523.1 extracellular solute-binding protein [Galbitalea sp. SE-J8]